MFLMLWRLERSPRALEKTELCVFPQDRSSMDNHRPF